MPLSGDKDLTRTGEVGRAPPLPVGGAGPSDLIGEGAEAAFAPSGGCSCLSLWLSLRLGVDGMHLRGVRQLAHDSLIQIDLHGVEEGCRLLISDIDLEPEAVPPLEVTDPYIADMPFPQETFDMDSGALLAREFFNPGKGQTRLPTPALPDSSPLSAQTLSVRSVFWYSEVEPVPESIRRVVATCRKRVCLARP